MFDIEIGLYVLTHMDVSRLLCLAAVMQARCGYHSLSHEQGDLGVIIKQTDTGY